MIKNYNFSVQDITVNKLNKLLKGRKNTIKDLYNYNRLNIFQVNKKSYVRIWTTNNITLGSMEYFMKLKNTFWHKQFIIFTDSFVFAWNGYDFTSSDIRTFIDLKDFYRIQDIKKAIAAANREKKTFYILQDCKIEYDSFWYDNVFRRMIPENERIKLSNIKYYLDGYNNEYIADELKNNNRIFLIEKVYKKDLYNHIDRSGYQLDYRKKHYKNIIDDRKNKVINFVNDFIKESTNNYFNIKNQLCYSCTCNKDYFILKMQQLFINYKIISFYQMEAETQRYIFEWVEGTFTVVMKQQTYKKIFKYKLNNIDYKLLIDSSTDITSELIESIKYMIHNDKLFIYETSTGIKACDTHIYNTCYDMEWIKLNPTFTGSNDEKIIACDIEMTLYKRDEIFKEPEHDRKTKILFNAITN